MHPQLEGRASLEPGHSHFVQYRFECQTLGEPFRVVSFEASEALNEPYRLAVQLVAVEEGTDSYQLLGRDVEISLSPTGGGSERLFRGIVDRVTIGDTAHTLQTCTVLVVPALFALSRTRGT